MLTTIGIGVLSSVVAELITWVNKKLSGTVLQGDAAFLLAAAIALVGAVVEVFIVPTGSWQVFAEHFAVVWAASQVWFIAIVQLFGLDVQPAPSQLG